MSITRLWKDLEYWIFDDSEENNSIRHFNKLEAKKESPIDEMDFITGKRHQKRYCNDPLPLDRVRLFLKGRD